MNKLARLFIFVFTLFILSCSNSSQTSSGDSGEENLGNDETSSPVIKRVVAADHPWQPGDKCFGGMTENDETGRKMVEYDYSACEELFKTVKYTYDDNDRIVASRLECRYENVDYNWIYNESGQLTEIVATKPTSVLQYKYAFKYDQEGNRIEYVGTMADGNAFNGTSRKTFVYEDGKKVLTTCYSGANYDITGYCIEHNYDENGLEVNNYIFKDTSSAEADTVFFYYEYY